MTDEERKELIGRVREVRANNNDLWMKLLELAITSNPVEASAIIEGICERDRKVIDAMQELVQTARGPGGPRSS